MLDRSAWEGRADVCRDADDEGVLGRSTILEIVHEEGERPVTAGLGDGDPSGSTGLELSAMCCWDSKLDEVFCPDATQTPTIGSYLLLIVGLTCFGCLAGL